MSESTALQMAPTPALGLSGGLGSAVCPECGRLAEVADRYVLASTAGPVTHIRLRCTDGRHHLTLIVEQE